MSDFRNNIHKEFPGRQPFWDPYAELNNVTVPSTEAIQNYQLAKIQEFQKLAGEKADAKNAALNALFKDGSVNSLPSKNEQDEDTQLNEALENIVKALNGTYAGNKSKKNAEYNYSLLKQQLLKLLEAVNTLNQAIINSQSGGTPIPASYITTINNAIAACSMESLDSSVLDDWFKHLNKFKGDLVEDIGVSWLSSLKIPDIKTLNTGALNYQGTERERKGQIIQDLMMLSIKEVDLESIPIEYKPPGSDGYITTSLAQFFNTLDAANGQHKQIVLNDSGYDVLLKLSQLNIQAKAGLNQRPWNVNKSTQVSIGEFSAVDGLAVSAYRTFSLLHSLDQEGRPELDWVATNSSDYNALANYGLATVLFKILHLGEDGNDYLLTPQGFTTYTDRLAELMSRGKGHRRIGIKGSVTVDDNTMGNVYDVDFVGS